MKIAHISYSYKGGGAAIAAARLHEALLDAGVESRFFCVHQLQSGREVVVVPQNRLLKFLFNYASKIARNILKPFYKRTISLNFVPSGMAHAIRQYNPDIVHIHWISAETISWYELNTLHYPFVVTLHDFWFVNGLDPHPKSDTRFMTGFTKDNSTFYERYLFNRKEAFAGKKKVFFTTPSHWGLDVCRKSLVAANCQKDFVPYIFNDKIFNIKKSSSPLDDRFLILFGADKGTQNQFKGFEDLRKALAILPAELRRNILLTIFGEYSSQTEIDGVNVRFLGSISSQEEMAHIYREADVFVFPSRFETFGQTKMEAIFCGVPVVAFNRSACAEGIVHKQNGYVARDGDCEDFANGISWVYENFKKSSLQNKKRVKISDEAIKYFGEKGVIEKWMAMYERCLANL